MSQNLWDQGKAGAVCSGKEVADFALKLSVFTPEVI